MQIWMDNDGKGLTPVILENEEVHPGYYKLALELPSECNLPEPGQFYIIRCSDTSDPLLRRPFSMHRLDWGKGPMRLEILYRVMGKGTKWLSERKKGEHPDIIGPLGSGFALENTLTDAVLIARGIGIAPLHALGEHLYRQSPQVRIHVLMGARSRNRVFYEKELKEMGTLHLYTDDGSLGFHGRAPQLLLHLMETKNLACNSALFACGPIPMLRELAEIAKSFAFQGQVALETHMGCGFGACLSCAVPLKPHCVHRSDLWRKPALQWSEDKSRVYSLICKDGPIYDIQEVDWDEWLA